MAQSFMLRFYARAEAWSEPSEEAVWQVFWATTATAVRHDDCGIARLSLAMVMPPRQSAAGFRIGLLNP
jgi:hypothetical protein